MNASRYIGRIGGLAAALGFARRSSRVRGRLGRARFPGLVWFVRERFWDWQRVGLGIGEDPHGFCCQHADLGRVWIEHRLDTDRCYARVPQAFDDIRQPAQPRDTSGHLRRPPVHLHPAV
jgi:hypothetical protein